MTGVSSEFFLGIAVKGMAPEEPGEGELKITFLAPSRGRRVLVEKTVELSWK